MGTISLADPDHRTHGAFEGAQSDRNCCSGYSRRS